METVQLRAIVYSAPGCGRCNVSKRQLASMGFEIIEEKLENHPDKIEYMKSQGYKELPLVEAQIDHAVITWCGYSDKQMSQIKSFIDNRA